MGNTRQLIPAARKDELLIQEMTGETLVYDQKSHKAHCLNRTAALVWQHCDGKSTAQQVARRIEAETGEHTSPEVVWLAVDQLEKSGLLRKPVLRTEGAKTMSRRELARRLGVATALSLPFIASLNVPAAIQAASCTAGRSGDPCQVDADCCSPFRCSGGGLGGNCFAP